MCFYLFACSICIHSDIHMTTIHWAHCVGSTLWRVYMQDLTQFSKLTLELISWFPSAQRGQGNSPQARSKRKSWELNYNSTMLQPQLESWGMRLLLAKEMEQKQRDCLQGCRLKRQLCLLHACTVFQRSLVKTDLVQARAMLTQGRIGQL